MQNQIDIYCILQNQQHLTAKAGTGKAVLENNGYFSADQNEVYRSREIFLNLLKLLLCNMLI